MHLKRLKFPPVISRPIIQKVPEWKFLLGSKTFTRYGLRCPVGIPRPFEELLSICKEHALIFLLFTWADRMSDKWWRYAYEILTIKTFQKLGALPWIQIHGRRQIRFMMAHKMFRKRLGVIEDFLCTVTKTMTSSMTLRKLYVPLNRFWRTEPIVSAEQTIGRNHIFIKRTDSLGEYRMSIVQVSA